MKQNYCGRALLFAAILVATQTACTYSAEPIEAWVIDADTKEPIEGVIVTANWQLTGGFEGGYPKGQMMVMESVTDKTGRFYFPAWGPKLHLGEGTLREDQPQLLLFKSGYEYRRLQNEVRSVEVYSGKSEWNGKRIKLKQFKGALKEYVKRFKDWNSNLDQVVRWNPKECNWKKLPKAILVTEREREKILAQVSEHVGVDPRTVGSLYQDILYNDDWYTRNGMGCGSPKEFFLRYRP